MATGSFTLKQVNQAIAQGAWSGYIAPKWVEYLVVAGGGGGGSSYGGGGGGAGGLLTGIVTVTAGTSYTVTVGSGGAGSPDESIRGVNGVASVFGSISTAGGGGGGSLYTVAISGGSAGGSGGGSAGYQTSGVSFAFGGAGVTGQGNYGGSGLTVLGAGGGGGGAGTVGLNSFTGASGNGGAGIASTITGTVTTYAGGGGAGGNAGVASGGVGGVGGGGTGATGTGTASAGSANTGGGGGGRSVYNTGGGAAGGSGIVVVRYPGNVQFYTGGAITYVNGYIVHIFYASGTLAPTTPAVVATDYEISRSLRFNSADSAYLNRTPASAGNRKTFAFSAWVKRGKLGNSVYHLFAAAPGIGIRFNDDAPDNQIRVVITSGNALIFTPVLRDPSAWYHIVVAVDTTQTVAADRVKLYINNQLAPLTSGTYPTQNADSSINNTVAHYIGSQETPSGFLDGYMTEINFIDGQQLTPSSFGATNANTGVWGPKAYTGTYGTNGFYLNFSDNSNTTAATLGKDYSGNGNNWTPNNFSVTAGVGNDSLVDVPTNYGTDYGIGGAVRGNYATLNPLSSSYTDKTFSNGNLQLTGTTTNQVGGFSTMQLPFGGQWYAECVLTSSPVGSTSFIGVAKGTSGMDAAAYRMNGDKEQNGTSAAYGATYAANDVIGVAVDLNSGSITFYKNGTSQGVAYTNLNTFTTGLVFACQNTSSGTSTFVWNFGQRAWAYTPPGGFKALVTQNLPTPTVGSSPTTLATKFFNPVLYTGNGSTNPITGVGFQPDWVWIKSRNDAYNHQVYDAVRGTNKRLFPSTTGEEFTDTDALASFDSDGFTSGAEAGMNASAITYVAWNWKANGAGVSNTAGSITSSVSANPTSGFSVVTYTGTGSVATVGHGLGSAPYMVIVKRRDGVADWATWHTSIGTQVLFLNLTDAATSGTAQWNGTTPTSSVFTVSTSSGVNGSGGTYVAYCFAPVAGFSVFGSYVGNGSADGVFVYTGFRPAYVLNKSTSAGNGWNIRDDARSPYNVASQTLFANTSGTEGGIEVDLLSNGFKIRDTSANVNGSSVTYIFAAFAETPFKYSLSR